ncbi:discoidin domain-containing protein [Actinoplanes sp. DH11]|uniref:discoidin domain-containing protein n=1 Tax=Actinoplanes sp. DH11 TaxID=2857011 RepID=UPI001E62E422|nr:discoidin domain-containing protein [Actinoplanes sp. DH11]
MVVTLLVATLLGVVGGAPAQAAVLPAGFREQTVLSGLDQPMNIEFAPDGRIFVAEKAGRIKVFDSIADTTATLFADLTANVHNQNDRGLLGLALHPSFPTVPYVYVLYTYDAPPGQTAPVWNDNCGAVGGTNGGRCIVTGRLSRLQAEGSVATGGETVLLHDWCQQFSSHSIGDLHFGADRMLYVSSGDGASFNTVDYGQLGSPVNPCADPPGGTMTPPGAQGGALRSQDVRTTGDPAGLDGTILRLDPLTGAAASGNPGIASPDANTQRIIAYGLRNPYRFAMRPGTSEIWVGDVGWNNWEEINRVPDASAVRNLGWPCFEGTGRQGGYDGANLDMCESQYTSGGQTAPHYTYAHTGQVVSGEPCPTGGSSTSGVAFSPPTGGDYPAQYAGALFFADYTRDCIWAMLPPAAGGVPAAGNRLTFVSGAANPVDLAIGPGGELYYADAGGTVRRIRYFAGNQPPNAVLEAAPTTGEAPLTVTFDARQSNDPDPADAGLLRYEWDFTNDGTVDARTATATHTYDTDGGPFTARLRVLDSLDAADEQTVQIQSGNSPPAATISTPAAGTTFAVGQNLSFSGGATDPNEGTLPASALRWRLLQYHCYTPDNCHTHTVQEWTGVASASFPAPDHEYPSYLELVLTATDAGGLSTTTTRRLDPRTVDLTFVGNPPGAQVAIGGAALATPFTKRVVQGSANTVSGVTPQVLGGVPQVFAAWSDGGSQTHTLTAPTTNTTYTATFVPQRRPQSAMVVRRVDSQESGSPGTNVLDGNPNTFWHTQWSAADPPHPHEIQLDLGGIYDVNGLFYQGRPGSANGRIGRYEVHVSVDGTNWGTASATGTFANNATEQAVSFAPKSARYVRLRALSEVNAQPWTSIAELNVSLYARLPRIAYTVRSVDSQETAAQDGRGVNVLDNDLATFWHTEWSAADPPHPHEIQLDLGRTMSVSCVYQRPRQNSANGRIGRYEVYTSTDGTTWGTPAATGTWPDVIDEQNVCFPARSARYVRLVALSETTGKPWTTVSEMRLAAR